MPEYAFDDLKNAMKEVLNESGFSLKKNPIVQSYESIINKVEPTNIADFLENNQFYNRAILVEEIVEGVGGAVDTLIRIHNQYDDMNQIPVEERKPIKIYINSPGGYVSETLTAIDAIKLSKTPVHTINIGKAYSGGFFIFITGHKRFSYPNASFLFHEGNAAMEGDAHKFHNYADFYKKELNQLKQITLEHTKFGADYYNEHSKDDLWLQAHEALELGIVDEIATELV